MGSELRDFQRGYESGYAHGVRAGKDSIYSSFEGTSIIIPTYNGKDLLIECLNSIEAHTELPYEIIVVDNGSDDGTKEMLQRRGGAIRLGIHTQNYGFARAVNTGLMMAKGTTIVLLNNDVLVTERWLSQMLRCLNDNPVTAAVGPVTNYIGGEQQINVPYKDIAGMRNFASSFNRSNPDLWKDTDRLVGFCLVFSRDTFEQVGYFDEGYKIGNYEDDDWMIRLRFQGKGMKIAGDTFVHHYGSMTMRELNSGVYQRVNNSNEQFFEEKWGNSFEKLQRMKPMLEVSPLRAVDFYPSHTWIGDIAGRLYWLEHGMKHALINGQTVDQRIHPITRLSVMEMVQIPSGPAILASQANKSSNGISEGAVVRDMQGNLFQIDRGKRRELLSTYACEGWGLHIADDILNDDSMLAQLPTGLPILPPQRLSSEDL